MRYVISCGGKVVMVCCGGLEISDCWAGGVRVHQALMTDRPFGYFLDSKHLEFETRRPGQ